MSLPRACPCMLAEYVRFKYMIWTIHDTLAIAGNAYGKKTARQGQKYWKKCRKIITDRRKNQHAIFWWPDHLAHYGVASIFFIVDKDWLKLGCILYIIYLLALKRFCMSWKISAKTKAKAFIFKMCAKNIRLWCRQAHQSRKLHFPQIVVINRRPKFKIRIVISGVLSRKNLVFRSFSALF